MRIAVKFLFFVTSVVLAGCLNIGTDADTDTDTANEAITATDTVATVQYQIKNLSSSTLTLDTASCSPSTSIFPPFSISSGSTVSFSATTTASSFLLCTVRYQDQTGVQGCQFQIDQAPSNSGFASTNAYKGSGSHTPTCRDLFDGANGPTAWSGNFTMQTN